MTRRTYFLDRFRVAATCAVVLLHTITGVMDTTDMTGYPAEKTAFLVLMDWITWCVPAFVMISGYLFLQPSRQITMKDMLVKYCRRIVFALFLFGVPYAWLELLASGKRVSMGMLLQGFVMVCKGQTWSHMWYLYLILLLYLVTPFLRWLLQKLPRTAVYMLLGVLWVGSSLLPFLQKLFAWDLMWVLPGGGIYFFYYICGYLFSIPDRAEMCPAEEGMDAGRACGRKPAEESMDGRRKQILQMSCVVCLAAGMAISRLIGTYKVQMAYNYPFTVLLSMLLMSLLASREQQFQEKKKESDFWQKLGKLCFTIYLIHPLFLNIGYKFFHFSLLDGPLWITLPITYMVVLLCSVLTAWILRKIKVLRKYVL